MKIRDDESLQLKARIALHRNEDSLTYEMISDCSICSLTGVHILTSIVSIRKWLMTKVNVKSAFLQTGKAERKVYVVPPKEATDRFKLLWLLLVVSYSLVNTNARFQEQSDSLLLEPGMKRVIEVLQLC